MTSQPPFSKLDIVTSTIVREMEQLGVYHYCKLTYLFEYFYIKNFGARYTGEKFLKLPHGPVIKGYKNQISRLHELNIIKTDIETLNKVRKVDKYYGSLMIESVPNTNIYMTPEKMVYHLIKQIVKKFGALSTSELEKIVYSTSPVICYQKGVEDGYKKKTGGYILVSDCIKIRAQKTAKTKGRMLALKHLKKYPDINFDNQETFAREFEDLEELRPEI